MNAREETQPKANFRVEPPPIDPEPEERGPGCMLWGFLTVFGLGLALLIVVLAGAAGWTSGQQVARAYATATQDAAIAEQIALIPFDVEDNNTIRLGARIQYLATLGVPQVPQLAATGTALAVNLIPTITPTPAPTDPPLETPTPAAPVVEITTAPGGGFDLVALLADAERQVSAGEYLEAVDILDAIMAVDPNYERTRVRGLMLEALTTRALRLYRSGTNLAEAIVLTDQAKEYGLPADSELHFEQYVASLYLTARSAIGTSFPAAIRALQTAYGVAPNYLDVRQLLFEQYTGFARAYEMEGNYCAAAGQYQNALGIQNSPAISAQRDNAQTRCEQGVTPIVPGTAPDGQPIAPVGVVETPGP